jgi:hypothetical protein
MSLSIIAYILTPFVLYGVARGFRLWLCHKSKELNLSHVKIIEKRFGVSIHYWFIVLVFLAIGFMAAFSGQTDSGKILWDVVFITLLVITAISIPSIILGLRGNVQYHEGEFIYNSGFGCHRFATRSILKCDVDGFGLIKITCANEPQSPIILPPIFKELPLLLALLQDERTTQP